MNLVTKVIIALTFTRTTFSKASEHVVSVNVRALTTCGFYQGTVYRPTCAKTLHISTLCCILVHVRINAHATMHVRVR